MNIGKKVIGVFAIALVIVVISAVALPALAASGNAGQGTGSRAGTCDRTCDQTQTRAQTRIRDGSCNNGSGADLVEGPPKQSRFGYGAANGCGRAASQHQYQSGNGSPPS